MLDLSPEKLLVLLTVGLLVVGPNKLPAAARGLANGLARARRLATGLTEPGRASLGEPRQILEDALGDLRAAVSEPIREIRSSAADPLRREAPAETTRPLPQPLERPASVGDGPDDPSVN
ncbi:MAG: twin-arginine translocase TatA/TatE family subunit [Acidimicrobiales bacterium]|nr:twin-arginine translocase TatA/TatE family subunit [Acidimicrobiales bacterium]